MGKKYYIIVLFFVQIINAQNVGFRSNGHINNFKKIDTLFFHVYDGQKPSTKTTDIDTTFSKQLIQLKSKKTFGFTTKNMAELDKVKTKLGSWKEKFSTSFYAYGDGTLQAPTDVLFFKPVNETTVFTDFAKYGTIETHEIFKGFYFLNLNTDIYNNGDKIFTLCDSLYNINLASIIEPVFVRQIKVQSDPLLPDQWNITNTGQYGGTLGADMKVANVWALGYTGAGVKVAVIDLGVDLTHPDLQANLLPGYDATGNNSGGGVQYDAYNFHGTCTAGIIAEVQNNIGGVGVAYNAKIIPIRLGIGYLTNQGISFNATDTQASDCFTFAVNNGADIISNSWTWGGSASAQIDAAIANTVNNGRSGKGTIVLFSTGNNNSSVQYPATNSNVIAVGASSPCDTRKTPTSCDGENWGGNYGTGLDVMAPGVDITTTTLTTLGSYVNNFNGTSAACPNVAGVCALILSAFPNLTGQQVRNKLESTCDKVGSYTYTANVSGQPNGTWCADAGYGRVDAYAAVAPSIFGPTDICITQPYSYSVTNLPAGATVTWSTTSNRVTLTQSGNTAYLQKNTNYTGQIIPGIDDGRITLQATINGVTPLYYTVYVYYPPANLNAFYDNSGTYITFLLLYNTTQYQVHYVDLDNQYVQGYATFTLPPAPVASGSYGSGSLLISPIRSGDRFQFQVAGYSPCGLTDYSDWYTFTSSTTTTTPPAAGDDPWSVTSAQNGMSISHPCPASSCGIEQFNFPAFANVSKYEITYTILYGGSVYASETFQTSSPPPYQGYVGGFSQTGLTITFKLRVQFTDGTWSDYASSPNQYAY